MRKAAGVILSASMIAACSGAGVGYGYSHFTRDGSVADRCRTLEGLTGHLPAPPGKRGDAALEDPSLKEYSWRRWPSLVDF